MSTLLEYLSITDPDLNRTHVKDGSNSFNLVWDEIDSFREWTDFTYENAIAMLEDLLSQSYELCDLDIPAQLRRATLNIIDEPTVTAVLLKWNHTIVDRALELASNTSMSFALGTHTNLSGRKIFPDWAGIDFNTGFPSKSRVTGDTKVSGKWNFDLLNDNTKVHEFYKPLRQVVHYAQQFNTRYAYVISDKELLCIRRSVSEYEASSQIRERGLRQKQDDPFTSTKPRHSSSTNVSKSEASPPFRVVITNPPASSKMIQGHLTPEHSSRPRQNSFASTVSAMSTMSLDAPGHVAPSPSASSYTDGSNPDVNEATIEVARIHWGETRPKHLTINLALFWIHILAGFETDLDFSYPPLGRELAEKYS